MGYTSKFTGEQIDALLEKAGQGGGGSASSVEYLDLSGVASDDLPIFLYYGAYLCKMGNMIVPAGNFVVTGAESFLDVSAISVMGDAELVAEGQVMKVKDAIPNFAALPRITEEEFYNIG